MYDINECKNTQPQSSIAALKYLRMTSSLNVIVCLAQEGRTHPSWHLNFINTYIQITELSYIMYPSLDSSVGRAEDGRGIAADILRSLVRIRFEGTFFFLR